MSLFYFYKIMEKIKAVLILEDGTEFHGYSAGKVGIATGELAFNTSMTGYQEIFTDPSYSGQLLISTNAHIGNYGINNSESESTKVQISGFICKNYNVAHSRKQANSTIQDYFLDSNLVAIAGIDTRKLVSQIRNKGVMNAIISSEDLNIDRLKAILKDVPSMKGLELASKVSRKEIEIKGTGDLTVAVLDFGCKENIVDCIVDRGCKAHIFPIKSALKDILAINPKGVLLSNGPGDPETLIEEVELIRELIKTGIPIFGICLGHQLLGLANGLATKKMKRGHRGSNHPVKNLQTGLCEITAQNHGFSLDENSDFESNNVEITHVNLNDNTIEGIRIKNKPVFSVQYHPEANPGPHDSRYLFDNFVQLVNKN